VALRCRMHVCVCVYVWKHECTYTGMQAQAREDKGEKRGRLIDHLEEAVEVGVGTEEDVEARLDPVPVLCVRACVSVGRSVSQSESVTGGCVCMYVCA
jgi:hypothetical protein